MQELVREYLGELRGKQKKRRRVGMIVAAFAVIIVGGVIWGLIQSGIAMTGDARCGIEEHTHSDACYTSALVCGQGESAGHQHTDACYETQSTLICGLEESEATEESEGHVHSEACYATEQVLVCGQEESAGHQHTDACYENQQTCGKEEHIHNDLCYIDADADVENASEWDAQYKDVEWKDAWGEDLVTAAKAQIGYKESTKNYTVAEDGSHKGYTRYGHFAGDVYTDWDASFVNFCMHYAGLEASNLFPNEKVTSEWYNKFVQANETNQNYITAPEGYEPEAGDIIFFNKEGEETEFQMGVVSSYNNEKNEIEVIEGNSGNEVKENKYDINDDHIHSYLKITELEKAYKKSGEEQAPAEEVVPDEEASQETEEERQIFTTETEEWAYNNSYEDDTIVINVSAAEGVVPEGAQLSVTPIEQKEVTKDMTEEEAAEAEKINEQYELTNQKLLEESEKKQETLEGFLAYDICFIVDGEEVEPSGDVKVTMDFKEATKPEGVSENATVAVNHLKEDESAADGVVVEDLTEKEDTTIATVETDASVEKIELVSDSFSTFTISWVLNSMTAIAPIEIEVIDENGKIINCNIEKNILLQNGEEINLYEQLGGRIDAEGEFYEVKNIRLVDIGNFFNVVKIKIDNFNFIFQDTQGEEHTYQGFGFSDMGYNIKIQLVCEKTSALRITDNVQEDGSIKAEGGDEILAQYPKAKYVWFKSVNGAPFEEVQSVRYDDMTTISDDGTVLNVALDNGGLTRSRRTVEYKVELQMTNENGEVESLAESEGFSVPYYSEVQNGSFEEPIARINAQHQEPMENVPGWKTTDIYGGAGGKGAGCIEIVRPTDVDGGVDGHYEEMGIYADEGKQFVEINAEGNGALYQDVLTFQDRPLKYYFSHRGRTNSAHAGNDKMYVVIIPTKLAISGLNNDQNPIDTNEEVRALLNMSQEFKESNGVYVQAYTARARVWQRHEGVYEPKTGMTRFFFVSDQDAMPSYGNYIDNVSFSQDLPKPTTNMFNLRVEKTVEGLELTGDTTASKIEDLKSKLQNLSFEIEVKNEKNDPVTDQGSKLLTGKKVVLNASDMIWYLDKEGTFTGYYDYVDNRINGKYTISVTEINPDVTDYTVASTSKTWVTTHAATDENGTEENEDSVEEKNGSTTEVESKQSVKIAYTNTYVNEDVEPTATKNINFTKVWEDFDNRYNTRPGKLEVKLIGKIPNPENEGILRDLTTEELERLFKKSLEEEPGKTLEDILVKEVTSADKWKCTWTDIPVYFDKKATTKITWVVEETLENNLYEPEKSGNLNEKASLFERITDTPEAERDEEYSITNVLNEDAVGDWKMIKFSLSDTPNGEKKTLKGAEFEMRETALPSKVIATGISNEAGEIIWTPSIEDKSISWNEFKKGLNGKYTIFETRAPEGYSCNNRGWEAEFINGILAIKTSSDVIQEGTIPNDKEIVFYIGNTALYALPDAGGSGIYWYMFSGLLLMAGAALITYKKRCREVLRS